MGFLDDVIDTWGQNKTCNALPAEPAPPRYILDVTIKYKLYIKMNTRHVNVAAENTHTLVRAI